MKTSILEVFNSLKLRSSRANAANPHFQKQDTTAPKMLHCQMVAPNRRDKRQCLLCRMPMIASVHRSLTSLCRIPKDAGAVFRASPRVSFVKDPADAASEYRYVRWDLNRLDRRHVRWRDRCSYGRQRKKRRS